MSAVNATCWVACGPGEVVGVDVPGDGEALADELDPEPDGLVDVEEPGVDELDGVGDTDRDGVTGFRGEGTLPFCAATSAAAAFV
jgi:hypothetical protein